MSYQDSLYPDTWYYQFKSVIFVCVCPHTRIVACMHNVSCVCVMILNQITLRPVTMSINRATLLIVAGLL